MLKAVFTIAVLALFTVPAKAVTLLGTGTGIVDQSFGADLTDSLGAFFPVGTVLTGKTAIITILIDLDAVPPIYNPQQTIGIVASGDYVPPGYLFPTVIGSGLIDIGGSTRAISGDAGGRFGWNSLCQEPTQLCNDLETAEGNRAVGEDSLSLRADGYLSGAPTGLFDIPTGNVCDRVAKCSAIFEFGGASYPTTEGTVTLSSLTFSVLGVPEPGSWAMTLIGFVAVGIALRRGNVTTKISLP